MQKKKIGYAAFLCATALACLTPAAATLWKQEDAVGNERLASAPVLIDEDGALNMDLLSDFSDYFADHFGYRHEMITGNSRLTASLFGSLDSDSVLLGKDGWLFYRETEDDYTGTNLFTARQSYAAAHTLALMQEYCEQNGVQFCFTIAPNKNSIYGEKMPQRYVAASVRNAQLLTEQLEAQNVVYADLFSLLSGQDVPLYYAYDSHWNKKGAQLAAEYLLEALDATTVDFDAMETGSTEPHTGDLYEMIYPAGTQTEQDPAYAFDYEYLGNFRSAEDITIRTENAGAQGSIYVYRDSFGINLHPFLAQAYGNACFSRSMPYHLNNVIVEQPDTLLVEIVERNLSWLIERAPELPAPERTLTETAEDLGTSIVAQSAESSMENYVCLSGDLGTAAVDADSPIYILAGDDVYEATPSGEGAQPFTAYLPQTAVQQALSVAYVSGDKLVCCALE